MNYFYHKNERVMTRSRTLFLLVMGLIFLNCSGRTGHEHSGHEASAEADWKEMDNFHMIMAETFHPYRDSANLEPAKSMAHELMTAAGRWAEAPLPERVDNDDMRSQLQRLESETRTLAETVRSEDDDAIGRQLNRVHDTFHEIHESWYAGQ